MAPGALILLSGGLDSATCLAIARDRGYNVCALSFRYGQRHADELDAAAELAAAAGVEHVIAELETLGGSALTGDGEVPSHGDVARIGAGPVPATYVPARNTIFLAHAIGIAEIRQIDDLFIGVSAVDSSGYPDCRAGFIASFEATANLGTRAGTEAGRRFRIHTPLIDLRKSEIIAWGTRLGVDYATTTSCYDPERSGTACGRCEACLLRHRGFREAGVADPTPYVRTPPVDGSDR